MIVLVTGAAGQVGREIVREARRRSVVCIALDRNDLDITVQPAVDTALDADGRAPDAVINLAAWTAVDAAEADPAGAFRVNRDGVANLARACARTRTPIVHVSTDYVFDGTSDSDCTETEPVHPINVYGSSKAAGEDALRSGLDEHLIIRTSWVFGRHGRNFVTSMLQLARTNADVRVVADEIGCPTGAADLGATLLTLAELAATPDFRDWGTYHFCGRPSLSRAAYARAIFEAAGRFKRLPTATVTEIASTQFPTPAKRPLRSVLDCGRIRNVFAIEQPEWRPCLERMLRDIARSESA
jgi:dTDP-4-dehydrorhamnose reductase